MNELAGSESWPDTGKECEKLKAALFSLDEAEDVYAAVREEQIILTPL